MKYTYGYDLFADAFWIDIYLFMQWHSYIFNGVLSVHILFGATVWVDVEHTVTMLNY